MFSWSPGDRRGAGVWVCLKVDVRCTEVGCEKNGGVKGRPKVEKSRQKYDI